MRIQPPPGMRDFYPADMRLQNWLFDVWRGVSRRFGFEEYEGPIFEYLSLYTLKSGYEIVTQLFHVSRAAEAERGGGGGASGREGEPRFAIRPEMTPTLARMVAARAQALPRPIKWFSIPRMCRAERQQRGRLREFFQWNVDILGIDDILADAEVIAVAVAALRDVGLRETDCVVRINSRRLATALLAGLGVAPVDNARAFPLLDRLEKLPPDEFARQWNEAFGRAVSAQALRDVLAERSLDACLTLAGGGVQRFPETPWNPDADAEFRRLFDHLATFDAAGYCEYDPGVVRGLAYYTGVVFETSMRSGSLRALQGGGRYDDLTSLLGGPKLSGIGFGMGDAPLLEALKETGNLPSPADSLDAFVIDADESLFGHALACVQKLRSAGVRCDFSYKRQAVGKQFKFASDRGARFAVVVGQEFTAAGLLTVKDLTTQEQQSMTLANLLNVLTHNTGRER